MIERNKYYDFFRTYESLTESTQTEKLQELSNNFNLNMLIAIWNDYNKYLESKGSDSLHYFDFVEVDEYESYVQIKYISNLQTLYFEDNILKTKRYKTGVFTDIEVVQNIKFIKHIDKKIAEAYNKLKNASQQPEPEPLDLSNTSAVQKIIYLNELGIIDFLRTKPEFMGSTNLMATVLSAITDVKATTLQTSLNRLITNDTTDKNHPYQTQKTVDGVRQTLIDKNIKPKAS